MASNWNTPKTNKDNAKPMSAPKYADQAKQMNETAQRPKSSKPFNSKPFSSKPAAKPEPKIATLEELKIAFYNAEGKYEALTNASYHNPAAIIEATEEMNKAHREMVSHPDYVAPEPRKSWGDEHPGEMYPY